MAEVDLLLGTRIKDDVIERVYSSHRIDYDSSAPVEEILPVDGPAEMQDAINGSVKSPPEGYEGHEAKDGYRRKVITETASAKDDIVSSLEDNGVAYVVEDVSPTQEQKDAIETWGAMNGLHCQKAMAWKRAVDDHDAGRISMKDFMMNNNPHRGESFDDPREIKAIRR